MASNAPAPAPANTSFRSRRSHQSLHHISLAPLTRFPVEDWPSNETDESLGQYNYAARPARTYLSSTSVPSTPPLISSHSRSVSHTPRSRTPTRVPLSDTNLENINSHKPLHHNGRAEIESHPKLDHRIKRQDSEWLLRAGLALAASTREEKGQAWLVKRESSTSLVSDLNQEDDGKRRSRYRSGGSRVSRSGLSTPYPMSRRGSRSHFSSRRASRGDLTMAISESGGRHARNASSLSEAIGSMPDFVDERIRAEMAYISQGMDGNGENENEEYDWNNRYKGSSSQKSSAPYESSSDSEFDSEDEVDELEMQRLTRERGFGLGKWVDRLVEWTLFSVDEEGHGYTSTSVSVRRADPAGMIPGGGHIGGLVLGGQQHPGANTSSNEEDVEAASEDDRSTVGEDQHPPIDLEKPSVDGGWADVGWLFRIAKKTVF